MGFAEQSDQGRHMCGYGRYTSTEVQRGDGNLSGGILFSWYGG